MDESKLIQLKEIFGVLPSAKLTVTEVSRGWNIRIHKPKIVKRHNSDGGEMSFRDILINAGVNMTRCAKCGEITYCHPHHIIARSAGGQDDPDNGIPLCWGCHVGNNGIHQGKWCIVDIVSKENLLELEERYEKYKGVE